jgi:transcriptional antiterminator RfaH
MGTTKRRIQRRWVETQLPLFPGYIFLHGSEQAYHHALETRKVVNSLPVDDEERLHQDLCDLNRLVETNHNLSLQPKLTVGTNVEVTEGSLAGMRGIVTRCDGESRIIIEIKMLSQQVSAQIDGCLLRKL